VDVYCNPAQDLFVLGRTFQEDGQYSFPLLEAQRCGLPVVTTDSGANREILAPGNPVVPQRNSTALVDAIVQLASDRRRQELGKANANFIAQRFDAERLQQKFDRAVAELGSG
jgi:glycosyltransferase involved in cell wall biosynthesis